MIEIKKRNYITGDINSVSYGLLKIIDFLDMEGRNIIALTKPKQNSKSTLLSHLLKCNKFEFSDYEEYKSILENRSNLFRVDLIVMDCWSLTWSVISKYEEILKKIDIDYIIVAKNYHYKNTDIVADYHIKKESEVNLHTGIYDGVDKYFITDKISGQKTNLSDLVKSYIRDKKIDGIIGDLEI